MAAAIDFAAISAGSVARLINNDANAQTFANEVIRRVNSSPKNQYTKIIRALHRTIPAGLTATQQQNMLFWICYIIGNNIYTMMRIGADLVHDLKLEAITAIAGGLSQIGFILENSPPFLRGEYGRKLDSFTRNHNKITEELDSYGIDNTPFASFPFTPEGMAAFNALLVRMGCRAVTFDCCFKNLFEQGMTVDHLYYNVASKFDGSTKPGQDKVGQRCRITYDPTDIVFNNFYRDVTLQMRNPTGNLNRATINIPGLDDVNVQSPTGISINAICGAVGLANCRGTGAAGTALRILDPQFAAGPDIRRNHTVMLKPAGDVGLSMIPLQHKLRGELVALISSDSFLAQLCQEKVDVLLRVVSPFSTEVDVYVFNEELRRPQYERVYAQLIAAPQNIGDAAAAAAGGFVGYDIIQPIVDRITAVIHTHTSFVFKTFEEALRSCIEKTRQRCLSIRAARATAVTAAQAAGFDETQAIDNINYAAVGVLQSQTYQEFITTQFKSDLAQELKNYKALAKQLGEQEKIFSDGTGADAEILYTMCNTISTFLRGYLPGATDSQIYALTALVLTSISLERGNERIDITRYLPAAPNYRSYYTALRAIISLMPLSFGSFTDPEAYTAEQVGLGTEIELIPQRRRIARMPAADIALLDAAALPGQVYVNRLLAGLTTVAGGQQIIPLHPTRINVRIQANTPNTGISSDIARIEAAIYGNATLTVQVNDDVAPFDQPPDAGDGTGPAGGGGGPSGGSGGPSGGSGRPSEGGGGGAAPRGSGGGRAGPSRRRNMSSAAAADEVNMPAAEPDRFEGYNTDLVAAAADGRHTLRSTIFATIPSYKQAQVAAAQRTADNLLAVAAGESTEPFTPSKNPEILADIESLRTSTYDGRFLDNLATFLFKMSIDADGLEPDYSSFVWNYMTYLSTIQVVVGLKTRRIKSALLMLFLNPSYPTNFIRNAVHTDVFRALLTNMGLGSAAPAAASARAAGAALFGSMSAAPSAGGGGGAASSAGDTNSVLHMLMGAVSPATRASSAAAPGHFNMDEPAAAPSNGKCTGVASLQAAGYKHVEGRWYTPAGLPATDKELSAICSPQAAAPAVEWLPAASQANVNAALSMTGYHKAFDGIWYTPGGRQVSRAEVDQAISHYFAASRGASAPARFGSGVAAARFGSGAAAGGGGMSASSGNSSSTAAAIGKLLSVVEEPGWRGSSKCVAGGPGRTCEAISARLIGLGLTEGRNGSWYNSRGSKLTQKQIDSLLANLPPLSSAGLTSLSATAGEAGFRTVQYAAASAAARESAAEQQRQANAARQAAERKRQANAAERKRQENAAARQEAQEYAESLGAEAVAARHAELQQLPHRVAVPPAAAQPAAPPDGGGAGSKRKLSTLGGILPSPLKQIGVVATGGARRTRRRSNRRRQTRRQAAKTAAHRRRTIRKRK